MANLEEINKRLNNLNTSSSSNKKNKSNLDEGRYNIENIGVEFGRLSLASDRETSKSPTKLDKRVDNLPKPEIITSSAPCESTHLEKNERETSEGKARVFTNVNDSKCTGVDVELAEKEPEKTTAVQTGEPNNREKVEDQKLQQDIPEEGKLLSQELGGRGPEFGVPVPRKPQQISPTGTLKFNDQVPCDFDFSRQSREVEENDPPYKYRRNGKVPQEHEEEMSSPSSDKYKPEDTLLQQLMGPSSFQPKSDLPDINPSISKYDSDEYMIMKNDVVHGTMHHGLLHERLGVLKEEVRPFESAYSPWGHASSPGAAEYAFQKSNQMENVSNVFSSIDGKLDSGDFKVIMQDCMDLLSMDPEEAESKVLSVTDLLEGNSSPNESSNKMSPFSDFTSSSPGSVSTNSPYTDQPTPGSDQLSSPGEAGEGDESSRDSFASSMISNASQGKKKLSSDQLPKPDMPSLVPVKNQSQKEFSGTSKAKHQDVTSEQKAKKSSRVKTGRPRGRPRKDHKTTSKDTQRPLAPIAPKPLLPQISGTTTLIIVQNPGIISNLNTGMTHPGIKANAPLAVTQAVVTGQPAVNPSAMPLHAEKARSISNSPSDPTAGKKTGALRPENLTDMLPSEKDKKNLKKAERIVAEIPQSKFTNQDSYGDTLLHVLSLSNRYEDLMDHLFDNSQSLFTMGMPQERFMYKALIDKMHNMGILANLINMRNKQNQTPLYLAVSTNKTELVRLLLEKGADPNICAHTRRFNGDACGFRMPLHVASSQGNSHAAILKLLLESPKIEVDATNSERKTALHCAVEAHNPPQVDSSEITELLIKHRARVHKGPNEKTPFHMVIEKNDYHFLRFSVNLLPESERKAILNMKDSLGNTCLHMCAVLTKHKDSTGKYLPSVLNMMRFLLLVCEVDISIVNQKNETAKKLVCKDNDQVMAVYREAENRRRSKRAQEKLREMEMVRLHQLKNQASLQLPLNGVPRHSHNPAMQHISSGLPYQGQQPQMGLAGVKTEPFPHTGQYIPPGIAISQGTPTKGQIFPPTNTVCQHSPTGSSQHVRNVQFPSRPMTNQHPERSSNVAEIGTERAFTSQLVSQQSLSQARNAYSEVSNNAGNAVAMPSEMPGTFSQNGIGVSEMTYPASGPAMNTTNNVPAQACNGYKLPMSGVNEEMQRNCYISSNQNTEAHPLVGIQKDCQFEDLERLVKNLGEHERVLHPPNGMFGQSVEDNNGNDLPDMPWNVPYTGTVMPYENAAVQSGSSICNNKTSQGCQQVMNGSNLGLVKDESAETTKNSFLEQLVNGHCTLPDKLSHETLLKDRDNDPVSYPENQVVHNGLHCGGTLTGIPGLVGSQSSPVANIYTPIQSHSSMLPPSSGIVSAAQSYPNSRSKSEGNGLTGMMDLNQPTQPSSIPTFQGDKAGISVEAQISTIPLHHRDFGLQPFEVPNITRHGTGMLSHNGPLGNGQFNNVNQNWMQNPLQAGQNM